MPTDGGAEPPRAKVPHRGGRSRNSSGDAGRASFCCSRIRASQPSGVLGTLGLGAGFWPIAPSRAFFSACFGGGGGSMYSALISLHHRFQTPSRERSTAFHGRAPAR